MRKLFQWLDDLLFGFLSAIGLVVTQKVVTATLLISSLLALTLAFYAGLQTLVNTLTTSVTNEYALMVFYAVLPSNATTCVTAVFTAELAAFMYRYQSQTMKAVAGIS